MKRNIISVLVGLVSAIAIFLFAESINGLLHPAPRTLDFKDNNAVMAFYENQPLTFWLLVLTGWIIGSALCGFLINLISKGENKKLPIIAGCILILSAIVNFLTIPHPIWFIIIGLVVFIPSTFMGYYSYKSNSHDR